MIRTIILTLICLTVCIFPKQIQAEKWCVYYNETFPKEACSDFDMAIVDATTSIPDKNETEFYVYIGMGELNHQLPGYHKMKNKNQLLGENSNWPGSYAIDWSQNKYEEFLLNKLIPEYQNKYAGIFLDTIDSAFYFNSDNHSNEIRKNLISCIKKIKTQAPELKIILNRGFELFPEIAPYIDGFMIENYLQTYDFSTKEYLHSHTLESLRLTNLLDSIKKEGSFTIYVLDYAKETDFQRKLDVFTQIKQAGYSPYIAQINLQEIDPDISLLHQLPDNELNKRKSKQIETLVLYQSRDQDYIFDDELLQIYCHAAEKFPTKIELWDISTRGIPPTTKLLGEKVILPVFQTEFMPNATDYIKWLRNAVLLENTVIIADNFGAYGNQKDDYLPQEQVNLFFETIGLKYHANWVELSGEKYKSNNLPKGLSLEGVHLYSAHNGNTIYSLSHHNREIPLWHKSQRSLFIQDVLTIYANPILKKKFEASLTEILKSLINE